MPRVPQPAKGDSHKRGKVKCQKCGTDEFFKLEDMLTHKSWCGAAKKKADDVVHHKKGHSNSVKHHR